MVIIWMSKYTLFSGFIISLFLNLKSLGLSRICDFILLCSVGSAQENQGEQIWLNNRAIGENNVFDVIMRWKRSHSGYARALAHRVNNRKLTSYFCLHWLHSLSMVQRLMLSAGYSLYYCKENIPHLPFYYFLEIMLNPEAPEISCAHTNVVCTSSFISGNDKLAFNFCQVKAHCVAWHFPSY